MFIDSVRATCLQDPAFCVELFGDVGSAASDATARAGCTQAGDDPAEWVPYVPVALAVVGAAATGGRSLARRLFQESAPKLLPSPRRLLLEHASDPKLRRRIEQLYRRNARVGNGSTADAIRHELRTGELLSPRGHVQKGIEMRNGLLKDLESGRLNVADRAIARRLLKDLQNALTGQ